MKYANVLVTGGAGFIGSHIVQRLISEGCNVTVLDNLTTGKMSNLDDVGDKKQLQFIQGDIRDMQIVKEVVKGQDAVFHEAAFVSVNQSVEDPLLANAINVEGTLNMLKASADAGVKRFVFASSAAVYGEELAPKKDETMMLEPSNPYGITKLAGESYVRAFWKVYKLPTVALRYFNVYGPKQSFDLDCAYGGAVTIFINRIMRDLPPVIYGDGEQTRDFIYVQDIVEANMLALTTEEATGQAFNIGRGSQVSVNQVAAALKQAVGKTDLESIYEPERVGEVKHGFADVNKTQKILKFKAKFGFQDGIQNLVDWYKQTQ
jgi:UDP-glucose 4-epimerase